MSNHMNSNSGHGLSDRTEADPRSLRRDARSPSRKIFDFLASRDAGALLLVFAFAIAVLPGLGALLLLASTGIFVYNRSQKTVLPFFLPMSSGLRDPNYPAPGPKQKPRPAEGITYLGNEIDTGEEIWFPNDVLRQHMLMMGTTGAGKTAGLVSTVVYSALLQGSGCIYVDGKGDIKLPIEIMALARHFGREDDVLMINYMTGNRDLRELTDVKKTNTFNPLVYGSASTISELIKSLLSSDSSGGDMWKSRAETFIDALVRPLVFLRDYGVIELNIGELKNGLSLQGVARVISQVLEVKAELEMQGKQFSAGVLGPLESYVQTLPGVKPAQADEFMNGVMPEKLGNTVFDQHGYITMQITPVVNMLAEDFGHIFNVVRGEVDMWDVVTNRRILIVLLPSLEKAPSSLANLGKIVLASLKTMMGMALGPDIEGDVYDTLHARPTNSPTPFPVVFDEVGYYFVEGMAITAAQGRSLGFQMIFGAQDVPGMERRAKEEAKSTIANTNIKIFGRVEDPHETLEIVTKRAGEGYVLESPGFERQDTFLGKNTYDQHQQSYQRRNRITVRDLARLREGEVFITYGDRVCHVRLFYADVKPLRQNRLSDFLEVMPPSREELKIIRNSYRERMERVHDIVKGTVHILTAPNPLLEIAGINMQAAERHDAPVFEAACLGLHAYSRYKQKVNAPLLKELAGAGAYVQRQGDPWPEKNLERDIRSIAEVQSLESQESTHQADETAAASTSSSSYSTRGADPEEVDAYRRTHGQAGANEADYASQHEDLAASLPENDVVVPPDAQGQPVPSSLALNRRRGTTWRSSDESTSQEARHLSQSDNGGVDAETRASNDEARRLYEEEIRQISISIQESDRNPNNIAQLIRASESGEGIIDPDAISSESVRRGNEDADAFKQKMEEFPSDYPWPPVPQDTESQVIAIMDLLSQQLAARAGGQGTQSSQAGGRNDDPFGYAEIMKFVSEEQLRSNILMTRTQIQKALAALDTEASSTAVVDTVTED